MKAIINLVLYSNLWIALCAGSMVLQTQFLLTDRWQLTPLVSLVFFATLFLYALHRIVGIARVHEFIDDYERYQVIAKYRLHIIVYAVLAAIGGLISFWFISLSAKLVLLLPGLISLAYVLPFLKGGRRLRDISRIKIFLIAFTWAFVSVLLVQLEMNAQQAVSWWSGFRQIPIWLIAIEKALFIFIITLPFDIRDRQVDTHSGVQTIPTLIGIDKTIWLAHGLIFLIGLLLFFSYQVGMYNLAEAMALVMAYGITAIVVQQSRKVQHDYYFTGLVDGMMLLQTGLLWLILLF